MISDRSYQYVSRKIPRSVEKAVLAMCRDYPRRKRCLENKSSSESISEVFAALNNAIDESVSFLPDIERNIMLRDICYGNSYYTSKLITMMSCNAYYMRRKKIIYGIAIAYNLIEDDT